jgi:tetratricopeptide (TPR) repeat protein
VLGDCAYLKAMTGCFSEARQDIARANAIGEELAFREFLRPAEVHLLADQPAAAEREARADQIARKDDPERFGVLSRALYLQGRYAEAAQFAATARAAGDADLFTQITGRSVEASVLARSGELEAGEQLAREAVRLGEETEWLNLRGDVLLDLSEILGLAGRHGEAAAAAAEALSLYEQKGNLVSARKARGKLDNLKERAPAATAFEPSAHRE